MINHSVMTNSRKIELRFHWQILECQTPESYAPPSQTEFCVQLIRKLPIICKILSYNVSKSTHFINLTYNYLIVMLLKSDTTLIWCRLTINAQNCIHVFVPNTSVQNGVLIDETRFAKQLILQTLPTLCKLLL